MQIVIVMTNKIKNTLGKDLYNQVVDMASKSGNSKDFKNFSRSDLKKVEKVFLQYKDSDTSVLSLYNFLSLYSLYNPEYTSVFSSEIKPIMDVTESFGYSELIADEYEKTGIL